MSGIVKKHVFIRLYDPDPIVFEMFLQPLGLHQRLRMRVLAKLCNHRKETSGGAHNPARGFTISSTMEPHGHAENSGRTRASNFGQRETTVLKLLCLQELDGVAQLRRPLVE